MTFSGRPAPTRELYRGRLFRVTSEDVTLSGGLPRTFERVERPPGVRILAADSSRILLTKEWRDETGGWDHRLPGGKVFDSLEDYLAAQSDPSFDTERSAKIAAQRELEEETSVRRVPNDFRLLHHSVCGATLVWDLYYFTVRLLDVDTLPGFIHSHEGERIQPGFFSHAEAYDLCLAGNVHEDRTMAVLLRYLLQLKR